MLELAVVPEKSLSNDDLQLVLGMALNQVIHSLQKQFEIIHGIQLAYSDKTPLGSDIVLNLTKDGIRLLFDPATQRLKLIEVNDLSKVKLSYSGTVFCSKEVPATREQIDDTFGATHPGEFDPETKMYHLKFRGLCFSFRATVSGLGSGGVSPLDNTDLVSSTVSKMAIYSGTCHKGTTAPPPLPISTFGNTVFVEHLKVIREKDKTQGVELSLVLKRSMDRLNKTTLKRSISFGDNVSDVVASVGSPSKIFYKEEDKMRIHSPNYEESNTAQDRSDYFYNYFSLGLDVLFDARRHTAKKIVLHTNYPGHYNFNLYHRCNFTMALSEHDTAKDAVVVTAFSKWDDISDRLVSKEERPVVLNRTSSTNTTNPFGSTCCYGCCGDIIIEVMKNKHIAAVTLFDSSFAS